MLDSITKGLRLGREKVRKGIVPKKMKLVIVSGSDHYFVQPDFFTQRRVPRPGRRLLVEKEVSAASRLITCATEVVPKASDVVVLDYKGMGTNQVSYVFWFAPPEWQVRSCEHLSGFVLSMHELRSNACDYVFIREAQIITNLCAEAEAQRTRQQFNT